MNNKTLLDAMDDVLRRLDLMSDEELQTEYENHKYGPVGRIFREAENFFAFLLNEGVEEHTIPTKSVSNVSYIHGIIETHAGLVGQETLVNDEMPILLAA